MYFFIPARLKTLIDYQRLLMYEKCCERLWRRYDLRKEKNLSGPGRLG